MGDDNHSEPIRAVLETINHNLFNGGFWSNNEMSYVSEKLRSNALLFLPEILNHALVRPTERQIRERNVDVIFFNKNNELLEPLPAKVVKKAYKTQESDELDAKPDGGYIILIGSPTSLPGVDMESPLNVTTDRLHYFCPKRDSKMDKEKDVSEWKLADWENNKNDFDLITAELTYKADSPQPKVFSVTSCTGRFEGKKFMAFECMCNGLNKVKIY